MRARCAIALTLWGSVGCRQLLGFEEPVVAEVDAPAAMYEVTGTYRQRYGRNDASFFPIVTTRIRPVGELPMSVVLPDGSTPAVDYRDDGTFSFVRTDPNEPYRFTTGPVEYQLSSPSLVLGEFYPGRRDAVPATLPTTVQVRLGPNQSGFPYVVSTGVWGQYAPQVNPGAGDFDIDWRNVTGAPPFGLVEAIKYDRLYVAFLEVTPAPQAYTVMTRMFSTSVTLNDGQTATFAGTPQPVPRILCVREQARRASAMSRVAAALPMFSSLTAEYRISAAPTVDSQFLPNLLLAYDVTTGSSDANLDVTYGNPFPGTQVLSGIAVTGRRDVALAGVNGLLRLVVVGLQSYQLDTGVGSCHVSMPVLDIGIAGPPSLAGVPLTTDGATLVIPGSEPILISWQLASSGPVDYAMVIVFEVVTSGPSPSLRDVRRLVTTGTSVTVDRDTFEPGRHYVLGVQTIIGAPLAAMGDFQTVAYPTGYMTTMSSPFQVGG